MKLRKVLFVLILVTLIFDIAFIVRVKHLHGKLQADLKKATSECAVIHKPAKAECPKGYVQESTPRFTEKDGSREFACVSADPAKEHCTDELRPGEGMTLEFMLPVEPPAPKPAGERKL